MGAEQDKKAREAAEKKATKLKAVEREAARLKATEEDAAKVKFSQKRPQSPKKFEEEPAKKKQRMEVARSYLKSIVTGSAIQGTLIRAEPLLVITLEDLLQATDKEATSRDSETGRVFKLRDEDETGAQVTGKDKTPPPRPLPQLKMLKLFPPLSGMTLLRPSPPLSGVELLNSQFP